MDFCYVILKICVLYFSSLVFGNASIKLISDDFCITLQEIKMVTVRNNMDTNVFCVDASKTIKEAIQEMLEKKVWSLVVTKNDLPVGVVTDKDVIRRCAAVGLNPMTETVEQIMSSPLITIGPDEHVRKALDLMVEKNIRRVYVVEGGKLIGRVTQGGAFRSLLGLVEGLSSISGLL